MNSDNPFGPEKLAALRAEIETHGLTIDKFLKADADVATFGINLACAWPFPDAMRVEYERMAQRFAELGSWLYVYPMACTHITLVTFISFARHIQPAPELVKTLEGRTGEILEALAPSFSEPPDRSSRRESAQTSPDYRSSGLTSAATKLKNKPPFALQPQAPVLSRAAVFLPMLNPGGEIPRLRQHVTELLQRNVPLHRELIERGLTVPGIIHSTIARFIQPPPDLNEFLAAFDEIAADTKFPAISVEELLLTSETKPFMRSGKVLKKFAL